MADRLTLKGYDDVTGQTGSDLTYIRPTGGRDFHLFPRWWNKKGTVQYENCTIFTVTRISGDVKVVIPTSINTHLDLVWDDSTETFAFPVHRGVDRVAIVDATTNALLQEYQFSRISGGSVLKRTISALPNFTIGSGSISGSTNPTDGVAESYTVTFTGNAADATYAWSTDDGTAVISAPTSATTDITFNTAGSNFIITCVITSATSTDSPVTATVAVAT